MRDYYGRVTVINYLNSSEASLSTVLVNPLFLQEIKDPSSQGNMIPLMYACFKGTVTAVKSLLEKDADIKPEEPMCFMENVMGQTALHFAANVGDPEIIKTLAQHIDQIVLHETDASFVDEQIKYPATAGLIVKVDRDQRNALHALCMPAYKHKLKRSGQDFKESIRAIFYYLSDLLPTALNTPDRFGVTPLMYARHYGYDEVLEVAREFENTLEVDSAEYYAVDDEDDEQEEEKLVSLAETHPAALQVGYYGDTELQRVVRDGSVDDVKNVLNGVADPSAANALDGFRNALHLALHRTSYSAEIVELLLMHIRTPTTTCSQGGTLIHYAAFEANLPGIQALCTPKSVESNSKMSESIATYNAKVQELLVQVNVRDRNGRTALHAAVMAGDKTDIYAGQPGPRIQVIEYLVKTLGINVEIVDNDGKTALDYAENRGYTVIAGVLANYTPSKEVDSDTYCNKFMNWVYNSGGNMDTTTRRESSNYGGAPEVPEIFPRVELE